MKVLSLAIFGKNNNPLLLLLNPATSEASSGTNAEHPLAHHAMFHTVLDLVDDKCKHYQDFLKIN